MKGLLDTMSSTKPIVNANVSRHLIAVGDLSVHVELVTSTKIPMGRIVITSKAHEAISDSKTLEVHFCNFRRYDWCWSFMETSAAQNGEGFCHGLDVPNGLPYFLPIAKHRDNGTLIATAGSLVRQDLREILLATMSAALVKMQASMEDRIRHEIPKFGKNSFSEALMAAMQVASPMWQHLLEDAYSSGAVEEDYFQRLRCYRGGRYALDLPITVAGFIPEMCWANPSFGSPAVVVAGSVEGSVAS